MLFNSTTFLFYFLPVVLLATSIGYFLLLKFFTSRAATSYVNTLLCLFSTLFYFWGEGENILVLLFSIITTFLTGILIQDANHRSNKRYAIIALSSGILCNILSLFWFKYANFGLGILLKVLSFLGYEINQSGLSIILPLGISFYTFQSVSYLIDVYRKNHPATRNFINYYCFITFFPQLIAGPIVRYQDIREELKSRTASINAIGEGLSLFARGLSKKVLIANPVGTFADDLFSNSATTLGPFGCWLAAFSYGIQILFDFSGYSDMAIGLGRVFGISIPKNFDAPYSSCSVREFWRRWHISLSSWFRDYLYIPIGGNSRGRTRTIFNLYAVFFICGLWHGASLNFAIWGLAHGTMIVGERLLPKIFNEPTNAFLYATKRAYTLLFVFSSWILFRSSDLETSLEFYHQMFFNFEHLTKTELPLRFYSLETQIPLIAGALISILKLSKIQIKLQSVRRILNFFFNILTIFFFLLSLAYVIVDTHQPFIYFRF